MRISYDPEVDALSITFRETTVTTKELGEGIAVDSDSEGKLAGLEILDAMKRFGGQEPLRDVVVERPLIDQQPTKTQSAVVAESKEEYGAEHHEE